MTTKDKFTQYPHINNIEDVSAVYELPEVIITEKVHGSSMRLGLIIGLFTALPMAAWTYVTLPLTPAIPTGWFIIHHFWLHG